MAVTIWNTLISYKLEKKNIEVADLFDYSMFATQSFFFFFFYIKVAVFTWGSLIFMLTFHNVQAEGSETTIVHLLGWSAITVNWTIKNWNSS